MSAVSVQEESRRLVGAERQRVAGMIYKEALQARTLGEGGRGFNQSFVGPFSAVSKPTFATKS